MNRPSNQRRNHRVVHVQCYLYVKVALWRHERHHFRKQDLRITLTIHKRLAIRRPHTFIVKLRSVPHYLVPNGEISVMINNCSEGSYMSWGILTGWVVGHGPGLFSNVPVVGYATWDLWSGESRFLPSQQLKSWLELLQIVIARRLA